MIITTVTLQGFGRYTEEVTFAFGSGLNVVVGPNEAGKTTLMNSIRAAFFGQKSHTDRWRSWDWQGESVITLGYRLADGKEYVLRRVMPGEVTLSVAGARAAGSSTVHKKLVLGHLGLSDEKLFDNTLYVGAGELETVWDSRQTKALRDRIETLLTGGEVTSASKALAELNSAIRQLAGAPSYQGHGGEIGRIEAETRQLQAGLSEATAAAKGLEVRQVKLRDTEEGLAQAQGDIAVVQPLVETLRRRQDIESELADIAETRKSIDHRLKQAEQAAGGVRDARKRLEGFETVRLMPDDTLSRAIGLQARIEAADLDSPAMPQTSRPIGLIVVAAVSVVIALAAAYLGYTAAALAALVLALAAGIGAVLSRPSRIQDSGPAATDVEEELGNLLKDAGVPDIVALHQAYSRIEEGERHLQHQEGVLTGVLADTSVDDLAKRRQDLLDESYKRESALSQLNDELPTNIDSVEAAKNLSRLRELEERVAALREEGIALRAAVDAAPAVDTVGFEEEIGYRTGHLSLLGEQHAGLELAARELAAALQDMQEKVVPGISETASRYLSRLSCGTYDKVKLDDNLDVIVSKGDRDVLPEFLSNGTFDQLYLALRVAIADALSGGSMPPLLLDDPFVYCDSARLARARETVLEIARSRQVFLFSHDNAYADWGDSKDIANCEIRILNLESK